GVTLFIGLVFVLARVLQAPPAYAERTAESGRSLSFALDDGTFVCLAPGSTLRYSAGRRTVLLQGQAYFKASENPHKPFVVESEHFHTEVLGTEFTVSDFDNQGIVTVALVSGRIRVTDSTRSFDCLLDPGKELRYDKSTHETHVVATAATENVE